MLKVVDQPTAVDCTHTLQSKTGSRKVAEKYTFFMVLVYKSRGMPIDMVDMRVLIIINIKLHMFKCFYIIQTIDKLAKWNNDMKDI